VPTKRRKIPPKRINEPVPAWAERLPGGKRPQYGTGKHDDYIGWLYFGDRVPGLPDPMSPEGVVLWGD
jgi:hypothetical protein